MEGGGTPASWVSPLKGESWGQELPPMGSGGGLNSWWFIGERVGTTLGEVLEAWEDGEQLLSGCCCCCEVAC